jgi:bacillithiol synthase
MRILYPDSATREILHLEANSDMFQVNQISFQKTGLLNPIIQDYIFYPERLANFYAEYPSAEAFQKIAKSDVYKNLDRQNLVNTLLKQAQNVSNTSEETIANIQSLKSDTVFTITTGHQLCIFTGPLYFIYKILSVIALCEELNEQQKEVKYVPVYWAATEDHDIEEINHLHVFGKKILWATSQKGAAGTLQTAELKDFSNELESILGKSTETETLIRLFEEAYLQNSNLADATRYLVNFLFGKYGLIIVDGNEREFKKQFISEFKNDLFQSNPYKAVVKTSEELKQKGYDTQVNPREINCFYLDGDTRDRIEKSGDDFKLVNSKKYFSKNDLLKIVESNPEKISPNVVLRPAYQQTILPNLAYVGGPGELAYWLQYKSYFNETKIHYPILIPRSSLSILDSNTNQKIHKLKLSYEDLFLGSDQLIKSFLSGSDKIFTIQEESLQVTSVFEALSDKIAMIDKSLVASSNAELQKTLNSLEMLKNKVNKALKQQSEIEIKQLLGAKEKIFPDNTLQERYQNFSMYYLKFGGVFIEELKKAIQAFQFHNHLILVS